MKTVIGIATFGGLEFTKLAVRSLKETIKYPYTVFIVVGNPEDTETVNFCEENDIEYVVHDKNYGFPYSVNDIYDFAWVNNDFEYCIIMGNDVIAYPNAINQMIELAETSDYELICANEYDVRSLCKEFPEAKKYFEGGNFLFRDFNSRPWELFTRYDEPTAIADAAILNVQNLCLYKKSVFDKIGYTDVNFYPAYFIDNDYARRAVNAEIHACTLANAIYFHFWSRTIKQGTGGSTNKNFENNRNYYISKWGGDFGKELWEVPFDGQGTLKMGGRNGEKEAIEYWRNVK